MTRITATRFPPGTLLGGRYEVLSLAGWGGMAEVYEALDRRLGRRVAVKVLREPLAGDERFLSRFRREARAAAALGHPNIVAVHDVGTHGALPFIVMELVAGRTLADLLRDEGPLAPDRAAAVGAEVATALAAAHEAGIVHRDVKPGNVMLTPSGEAKVLDFGVARAARWTPLTDTPAVHGTAEYLSPEQARGEEVDGRSDIYSLGVLLYECLTGRPPFTGETSLGVAYQHLEETPVPPVARRPGIPRALSDVVMRCLEKDPEARYGRAEDLAKDLGRVLAGEVPTTAPLPPAPATGELRRWRPGRPPAGQRRRARPRRRAAWFGGAALLLGGGLAVMLLGWPGSVPEPVAVQAPPPALEPPATVRATGACAGFLQAEVTVAWSPSPSRFADGYEVYRGTVSGGPYERVAVVRGRTNTEFVDAGRQHGTSYFYVIRSTAGERISAPSGQAQAETPFACLW